MIFFLDFDRTLFDTEKFYNALERGLIMPSDSVILADIGKYLYEDTLNFLESRNKNGDKCVLVSRGEVLIQNTKFESSGLSKYFLHALYVDGNKTKADVIKDYLDKNPTQDKLFFIDDTIKELEGVISSIPKINTVRMRRISAKNHGQEEKNLTEVANFNDLVSIL